MPRPIAAVLLALSLFVALAAPRPAHAKKYYGDIVERHKHAGRKASLAFGVAAAAPLGMHFASGDVKTGLLAVTAAGFAVGVRQSYNFMRRTLYYNGK